MGLHALWRYLVVGAVTNGIWFAAYLAGTWAGVPPLVMATICYVAGVATSYAFNRGWSFQSRRAHAGAIPRYAMAYGLGYMTNMLILYILYVRGGLPHQYAQLISAALVALELFLVLRLWVFRAGVANAEATTRADN